MRISLWLTFCVGLALAGYAAMPRRDAPCARLPMLPASVRARTLNLAFQRDPASQPIALHLTWAAPGAPFYTRYGPLRSATFTEGAATVVIPPEQISHIEDFWPDLITLRSARRGDYELSIPQGIPAPVPEIITVRSGRFVSTHADDSFQR